MTMVPDSIDIQSIAQHMMSFQSDEDFSDKIAQLKSLASVLPNLVASMVEARETSQKLRSQDEVVQKGKSRESDRERDWEQANVEFEGEEPAALRGKSPQTSTENSKEQDDMVLNRYTVTMKKRWRIAATQEMPTAPETDQHSSPEPIQMTTDNVVGSGSRSKAVSAFSQGAARSQPTTTSSGLAPPNSAREDGVRSEPINRYCLRNSGASHVTIGHGDTVDWREDIDAGHPRRPGGSSKKKGVTIPQCSSGVVVRFLYTYIVS